MRGGFRLSRGGADGLAGEENWKNISQRGTKTGGQEKKKSSTQREEGLTGGVGGTEGEGPLAQVLAKGGGDTVRGKKKACCLGGGVEEPIVRSGVREKKSGLGYCGSQDT